MKKLFRTFYLLSFFLILCSMGYANVYTVTDFGAIGDGKQSEQQAIQAAIDECAQQGGGTVLLPAGEYRSGELRLRSQVTLNLAAGATLYASTDAHNYSKGSRGRLLVAQDAERISIVGEGTIHGQGTTDYGSRWGVPDAPPFRTGILLFEDCRFITVRDITILYSDSWTLHLKRCENVTIDSVTIFNNIRRLNSDGIDPNSCRNVHISNCHIIAGDDCIVLKTTEADPCENVVVTNCTLETTTTAIKLGTESRGDFRDIHFSNCTIRNTRTGIGFFMKDGTVMERVSFSNISIETPNEKLYPMDVFPIFMDIEKRHVDSPIGTIRDIIFRDILIHSGSGILIQGMPESPIENLTLQNIVLRADWVDDYSKRKKAVGGNRTTKDERDTLFARQPSFITLAYVKGLSIDNIQVTADKTAFEAHERSLFFGWGIALGTLQNMTLNVGLQNEPVVNLQDCYDMLICNNRITQNTATFLNLSGAKTNNISLAGNSLRNASHPFTLQDQVSSEAIHDLNSNQ